MSMAWEQLKYGPYIAIEAVQQSSPDSNPPVGPKHFICWNIASAYWYLQFFYL